VVEGRRKKERRDEKKEGKSKEGSRRVNLLVVTASLKSPYPLLRSFYGT
jgi:hypothetical protein